MRIGRSERIEQASETQDYRAGETTRFYDLEDGFVVLCRFGESAYSPAAHELTREKLPLVLREEGIAPGSNHFNAMISDGSGDARVLLRLTVFVEGSPSGRQSDPGE